MVVKVLSPEKIKILAMTKPMIVYLNCLDRSQWPEIRTLEAMQRTALTDKKAVEYLN
jgi:hypothetical protein